MYKEHFLLQKRFRYSITVYDPNDIEGESHLQLIEKLPVEPHYKLYSSALSRSSGGLSFYGKINDHGTKIWMIPKGQNGYRCLPPYLKQNGA